MTVTKDQIRYGIPRLSAALTVRVLLVARVSYTFQYNATNELNSCAHIEELQNSEKENSSIIFLHDV